MKDQEQSFAAFVLETLKRQSAEIGQRWAERAQLPASEIDEPDATGNAGLSGDAGQLLVQTLLEATGSAGARRDDPVMQAGWTMGMQAHRQTASLQLMLKEVDILASTLLEVSERVAVECAGTTSGHEGLAFARQIHSAISRLRNGAMRGYVQSVEDELRTRYRAIRHDLRNPLSTIRSAVSLLTDDSLPLEMRQSSRVRAMVVRNARLLDQMIGAALGDAAACLPAFATPHDRALGDSPPSDRQQRDNVAHARQRSDLESGAF